MRDSDCRLCPLLSVHRTQIVAPTPCPPGGLLAVGEAPGADEDEIGEGFVGQAGRVLDDLLVGAGLERNRDYGVANIVRCRPPANRKPNRDEVANCLPKLAEFLLEARPSVVLLVGLSAARAFLGGGDLWHHILRSRDASSGFPEQAYEAIRGALARLQGDGFHLVPMPHTSGLAWNRNAPNGRRWSAIGREQVELAVRLLRRVSHAY